MKTVCRIKNCVLETIKAILSSFFNYTNIYKYIQIYTNIYKYIQIYTNIYKYIQILFNYNIKRDFCQYYKKLFSFSHYECKRSNPQKKDFIYFGLLHFLSVVRNDKLFQFRNIKSNLRLFIYKKI